MISRLRDMEDWQLSDPDQDIRGWPVRDSSGRQFGTIDALLIDTDQQRVQTAVLDNGSEVPISELEIGDGQVRIARDYAARFAGTGGMTDHALRRPVTRPASEHKDDLERERTQEEIDRGDVPDAGRRIP